MNREQFFGKLAALSEQRLRKAMWNLYWRGSASMRERIEAELDPDRQARPKSPSKEPVDPEAVLGDVRDFVALARSGAYIGGDRRVTPRERTRWRFEFHRLVTEAQDALHAENVGAGATALEQLVDFACEMRDYDYFRSDDPVEAARFVVSDTVALLWDRLRGQYGFAGFVERAAPQFIRWESRYGWTRSGWGRISEKETSLASVLAANLPIPDAWINFADHYLDALDMVVRDGRAGRTKARRPAGWNPKERTAALAQWHLLLLDRLPDYEADDRLDRLADHPALGGPELMFLKARLAHQRGDVSRARSLVHESLQDLPGQQDFLDFATGIGAPLPPRAQQIAKERSP